MAGYTVGDLAQIMKVDVLPLETLSNYLFPDKILFSREDCILIRDYYMKFGHEVKYEFGPYDEYYKLERMAVVLEARLASVRDKQRACVNKMNAVTKLYQDTQDVSSGRSKAPSKSKVKELATQILRPDFFLKPRSQLGASHG